MMLKVCGKNEYNQLGEESNNQTNDLFGQDSIISPPAQLQLDISSLISYSVYFYYTVIVTKSGKVQAIGNNSNGAISKSLIQSKLGHFTEFEIKTETNVVTSPISAVCGFRYTLYIVSSGEANVKRLVYSHDYIGSENPLFLNIGGCQPLSIYGGENNSAAVDSTGAVIVIPYNLISEEPSTELKAVFVDEKVKTVSVACLNDIIFALGSNGKVYESNVPESRCPSFSVVDQFDGNEIVEISGISDHCFAVDKNGIVYGRGSNIFGRLGLEKKIDDVDEFVRIKSLDPYKIVRAYAGFNHSLFQTENGKILACGANPNGELLFESGPCDENIFQPKETIIDKDASFCIAGCYLSAVFLNGCPENCPNKKITKFEDVNEEINDKLNEELNEKLNEKLNNELNEKNEKNENNVDIEKPVETKESSSKCCLLL